MRALLATAALAFLLVPGPAQAANPSREGLIFTPFRVNVSQGER
jgi:hypothetical protein